MFDYGGHGAADTMRVTQEKIQQYVGIKYSKDIANELKNKVQVVIKSPEYSNAIEKRHVKYQALFRSKQTKLLTALQAKLSKLQVAAAAGNDFKLEQANLENENAYLQFKAKQEVPHKFLSRKRRSTTTKTRPTACVKQRWRSIVGRCMH